MLSLSQGESIQPAWEHPHPHLHVCNTDTTHRHGARLDAADPNWHLTTPTPYDPPLTYGGWTQCRALGVRIASLLQAREQSLNDTPNGSDPNHQNGNGKKKRKRKTHKVVIHSSPFLRCIQTSVAISAGMSQYHPTVTTGSAPISRSRTPNNMHSASPRLRAMSPSLAPISEPKQDFAHEIARKMLADQQQQQHLPNPKSKLRVDAFLGEWMNPQYYEHITPPPPSALMVATAKGELMQNEHIDVYTPTISSKSSTSNLWGGGGNKGAGTHGTADDWSHVRDALPAPTARRDRASSVNSGASSDTGSGRRSPFKPGHGMQSQSSTMPKYETTAYIPPTPSYAVSTSDHIPRGYVAHARNATVNVDYQWDSSRSPQSWGDGGLYGEEWTSMHRRFRRGLNDMIHWYSQHDPDDRNEDSLGIDQAEHKDDEAEEEEEEDLVVVLITHGAGSNALIGAITEQPVLLDVGMASLTMAVKREDAPTLDATSQYVSSPTEGGAEQSESATNGNKYQRRGSFGTGLSAMYEMKIIASTEHLRPGSDPSRASKSTFPTRSGLSNGNSGSRTPDNTSIMAPWNHQEDRERNKTQSSALGSIRRPGHANSAAPAFPNIHGLQRRATQPISEIDHESAPTVSGASTPASVGGGLWTPPAGRTPLLDAQRVAEDKKPKFPSLDGNHHSATTPGDDMVLDFSDSPPDSRPGSSGGMKNKSQPQLPILNLDSAINPPSISITKDFDGADSRRSSHTTLRPFSPKEEEDASAGAPLVPVPSAESERDVVPELPSKQSNGGYHPGDADAAVASIPESLSRKLSQKGLWGTKPSGDQIKRSRPSEPKRRWTVSDQDGNG
jgi:broad specificity phosphatase PhoE